MQSNLGYVHDLGAVYVSSKDVMQLINGIDAIQVLAQVLNLMESVFYLTSN